jgi:hypothetical protein
MKLIIQEITVDEITKIFADIARTKFYLFQFPGNIDEALIKKEVVAMLSEKEKEV